MVGCPSWRHSLDNGCSVLCTGDNTRFLSAPRRRGGGSRPSWCQSKSLTVYIKLLISADNINYELLNEIACEHTDVENIKIDTLIINIGDYASKEIDLVVRYFKIDPLGN